MGKSIAQFTNLHVRNTILYRCHKLIFIEKTNIEMAYFQSLNKTGRLRLRLLVVSHAEKR
jgi:hypothetical protein